MPLHAWRYVVRGYEAKVERQRELAAWSVSYLLIGAGCDAAQVTPDRLLGREASHADTDDEDKRRAKFDRMWARAEKKKTAAQQQQAAALSAAEG